VNDACVICGETDEDTTLGWTVCAGCFRIDDHPVQEWPSPWVTAARWVAVVMFVAALLIFAAALGTLARAAAAGDCGIDAPDVCASSGEK
jgi:hypothetical protein